MPCAVRPADLRVRLSVTGERVDRLDDMMPCRAVRTAGPDEICIRAPSGGVELFMHRPGDGVYSRHSVGEYSICTQHTSQHRRPTLTSVQEVVRQSASNSV